MLSKLLARRSRAKTIVAVLWYLLLYHPYLAMASGDMDNPISAYWYLIHKPSGHKVSSCSVTDGSLVAAVASTDETNCSKWSLIDNGEYFHLKNRYSEKVLAPERQETGGGLFIQPNSWSGHWTQWSLVETAEGFAQITNRFTGNVLYHSGAVGGDLELQPASWNGDYTQWELQEATSFSTPEPAPSTSSAVFTYVAHKPTGFKLGSCASSPGENVVAAAASDTTSCTQWEKIEVGEFFFLKNAASGLHLAPQSTNDGSPLVVQPDTWTGSWVQWSLHDVGDGYARLVHRHSGKWVFLGGNLGSNAQLQPTTWTGDYTCFLMDELNLDETPAPTPTVDPTLKPTSSPTFVPVVPPTMAPPAGISTPGSVFVEAESGSLEGIADVYIDSAASGGEGVAFISEPGSGLRISHVPLADTVIVGYTSQNTGAISVRLNGRDVGNISFNATGAWVGRYNEVSISLDVELGASFEIFYEDGDTALNLDYIVFQVSGSTSTPSASSDPTPSSAATPIITPSPRPIPTASTEPVLTSVTVNYFDDLGNVLVAGEKSDKAGFTLYTFANDSGGPSVCNGLCAETWPPFLIDSIEDLIVPDGITGLGALSRQDGSIQVAFNSEPLYFYSGDTQPRDTRGHGIENVWFAADIPAPRFVDPTWENAALPPCSDLYAGNIPAFGYHSYIEGSQLTFNAGNRIAGEVWGNKLRAVFFRTSESTGRLEHIGTVEGERTGDSAVLEIPAGLLEGKVTYYVSYERFFTPMSEEGKVGRALAYADSALYALNRPEGCVTGDWSQPDAGEFSGWVRRQHPQGVFNDHNVFAKSVSSAQNSATHFMHVPRFVVKVVQDQAGKDLIFNVVFAYEEGSPFQASSEIIVSAIEGKGARAGDGSPLHSFSFRCDQIGDNEANCNAGKAFSYGQNVDWELRVQPVAPNLASSNLYSQMLYYVPGHGWAKESVDPRAQLGGQASVDVHGATVYERAAAYMQHEHTASLQTVRDFVRQHQNLRDPIGTPLHGSQFDTCESCHINDGRSDAVFTMADGDEFIAPPLIGLGLLERIVDFPGKVGFGWRGDRATVEDSVRSAFETDFDIANPDSELLAEITHYTRRIAVPQRDKSKLFEASVIAGEKLFKRKMQCVTCHQETQQLDNGDVIRPYTDMRAHRMAGGTYRTAPLWAIGRAANVVLVSMEAETDQGLTNSEAAGLAQRTLGAGANLRLLGNDLDAFFMHDGRAKGLDAAVRAHGGEAATAAAAYIEATQIERNQLLDFLRSL